MCYKLKTLKLVKKVNLVLGWHKRTWWRTLYKIVYLIYIVCASYFYPTLNSYVLALRSICIAYTIWSHPSRTFYILPWVMWLVTLWSHHFNPNPSSKNQKWEWEWEKIKFITFVKNTRSGLKLFLFLFSFLFSFWFIFLYSIFRTRVRVRVTRSCCHTAGHIR